MFVEFMESFLSFALVDDADPTATAKFLIFWRVWFDMYEL